MLLMIKYVIIRVNNTFVNKTTKRLVPLSVCPCLNNNSYNCYMADVYAVYPGQLLHVNLLVSPMWSKLSWTIIAANTKMMTIAYWTVTSCHRHTLTKAVTDTITPFGQTVNL